MYLWYLVNNKIHLNYMLPTWNEKKIKLNWCLFEKKKILHEEKDGLKQTYWGYNNKLCKV